jgi:3-hydroxyacyl-CoA dehydrogenase/enoyl-CoA hydratase/3-hydroxybutyryl-CoA epimerase
MVDDLVPREYLVEKACQLILKCGMKLRVRKTKLAHKLTTLGPVVNMITKKVSKQVFAKTRGHYPAVPKALEVVTQGLSKSLDDSLALERDAILELGTTEACKNLIRIFFLQERAKKLTGVPADAVQEGKVTPVKRVTVVGAGVMGGGIAQWSSARGLGVILRDINHEALAKGLAGIAKVYDQAVKRHAMIASQPRRSMCRSTRWMSSWKRRWRRWT